ncbi:MAG: tetratricopeptide repeat protein [Fibromonadales bacterium]|nr:tetratricopeptide repeat protein [Fibromonadales bacterium]
MANFEDLEKNGDAHLAKKEIEPAIAYYTAALSIKPDIQTALLHRGIAYSLKGDYEKSIADFTALLKINPSHADAKVCLETARKKQVANLYNYAATCVNSGKYDQAIAGFSRVLKTGFNTVDTLKNRGFAYAKKGNYDQAIADYEAALRMKPNDINAKELLEKCRKAKVAAQLESETKRLKEFEASAAKATTTAKATEPAAMANQPKKKGFLSSLASGVGDVLGGLVELADDLVNKPGSNEAPMIASAVQNGKFIDVYDSNGSYMFCKDGELIGYTANTLSVKVGRTVDVYDNKGDYMYCR